MCSAHMIRSTPRNQTSLVSYSHHTDAYQIMADNFELCSIPIVVRCVCVWLCLLVTYQTIMLICQPFECVRLQSVKHTYIKLNWTSKNNTPKLTDGGKNEAFLWACLCAYCTRERNTVRAYVRVLHISRFSIELNDMKKQNKRHRLLDHFCFLFT